jgi:hypothetical protein
LSFDPKNLNFCKNFGVKNASVVIFAFSIKAPPNTGTVLRTSILPYQCPFMKKNPSDSMTSVYLRSMVLVAFPAVYRSVA